ncbi:conjugal transfer protein TraF [Helicobacter sp. faydin-H20]|uniref:conjugal transfer protein TraF n=1 Tax=Helicobacter anatolicus TaxID=2905874 RepID=UPI001E2B2D52|nr:conjugal transfer protein TraF [Helicobacter anatolicus]MCE3036727.1 conjugal transfer protein TraF [Helicobacter anatolicus]
MRIFNSKTLLFSGVLLSLSQVQALEFGGMGNISASMGGAGVALKNSQWGLYYNPALLGTTRKYRFAYSFGATIRDHNLLKLANVDIKNLQSLPSQISGIFSATQKAVSRGASSASGTTLLGASTLAASDPLELPDGYFGEVIKNLLGKGSSGNGTFTEGDLAKFLGSVAGNGMGNGNGNLDEAVENFKKVAQENPEKILGDMQDKLLQASASAGGNALLDSIIKNLDSDSVSGLADLLKDASSGNIDVSKVVGALKGVEISQNGNASLAKAIKDIQTIENTLKSNNFSFSSQNGLVFQTKPNDDVGGFGIGIFGSAFASGSASFDSTHNRLIIDAGGEYVELGISGDKITLDLVGSSAKMKGSGTDGKNIYESSSVFSNSAKHNISLSGLIVGEVPVGYGHSIDIGVGEISVGMTLKYLYGVGYHISKTGNFNALSGISLGNAPTMSHNFGIDIGALYSIKGFSVGFVAKNINEPALKLSETEKIYLNPQLRAGIAYQAGFFSLAFDADLLPNHTLSYVAPKNQMVGGGMMFDFKYVDVRVGTMYDLRNPFNEGVIFTGGINLFGFLDIAVQSNTHLTQIRGMNIPSYFSLKVGGGFSW